MFLDFEGFEFLGVLGGIFVFLGLFVWVALEWWNFFGEFAGVWGVAWGLCHCEPFFEKRRGNPLKFGGF